MSAQNHYELWSKLYLEKKLGAHWSIGLDAQHRLQSDYHLNHKNIIEKRLLNNARLWINYKSPIGTIVISPYAWFRNYDIDHAGFVHKNDEWRMALGIQRQFELGKLETAGRILTEHRQIMIDSGFDRIRFQLRIRPLIFKGGKAATQPYFQEEYFYRINGIHSIFDQNRIQLGIRYKKSKTDISLAYQYSAQRPSAWINRHQAYIAIQYSIE